MPSLPWPLWTALGCAVFWIGGAWLARARLRQLPPLPERGAAAALPPVALCIPARDEAREVGRALDSWLGQDYPDLRIVVVDDGSRDATPALLASRAARHGHRLRVHRNDGLPRGWLGKNHALHLASCQPEALAAPWLLFADADVRAGPGLLRRAFAFLEAHPGDLLALLPAVDTVALAERMFIPWATLGFLWAVPFARVPCAKSRAHCGVGAFILVRRCAYDAVHGHAGAPMELVDDMGLARRVKAMGYTNRVALAGPALRLRMYHGLGDLLQAMRKNALAKPLLGPLVPLAVVVVVGLGLSPVLLAWAGFPWAGAGLWALVALVMANAQARFTGWAREPALALWPLNGFLLAAGLLWAAGDRLRGVNHWRGREVKL
jgi:hypothetical protein